MDEQASLSYDSAGELDSSYVYNFNQNPVAGKIYSYEIVHSDYEAVRAETTVPAAVKLNVNNVTLLSNQDYEKHYRVRFSLTMPQKITFTAYDFVIRIRILDLIISKATMLL